MVIVSFSAIFLTTDMDKIYPFLEDTINKIESKIENYVKYMKIVHIDFGTLSDTTPKNTQWRRSKNYYGESLWGTDWKSRTIMRIEYELEYQ